MTGTFKRIPTRAIVRKNNKGVFVPWGISFELNFSDNAMAGPEMAPPFSSGNTATGLGVQKGEMTAVNPT